MRTIEKWVQRGARDILSGRVRFISNHLDEIDYGYDLGDDVVAGGREALVSCITELQSEQYGALSVRLAVPLGVSSEVVFGPPTVAPSPANRGSVQEPPSLYLCRSDWSMYMPYFEEYRIPVDIEIYRPPVGQVLAWYSCQRSLEARAEGWEFGMNLWFDYLRGN